MRACLVICVLGLSGVPTVWAEQLPSYLNSNETERNLPAPNLPTDAYRPATPKPQLPTPQAPEGLRLGTEVEVSHVQVQGGTVYSLDELAAVYKPLLGHKVRLDELINATRSITQRYRNDGYLLSYAYLPPQQFAQGQLQVVLVEGYVKDYQIVGDVGPVESQVRALLDKIQGERPLTRKTFERYTSLLNRIPGVTVRAEVPPPGTTDGATRLIADASRKPWTSSMNLSESSRDQMQTVLSLSSNSQTPLAEQISVSGLFPPGDDDEHYYRLDYSQFLGDEGTQFNGYYSSYESEPDDRLRLANGLELKRKRKNERLSLGFSHPWLLSRTELLSTTARLYGVDDETRYEVIDYPIKLTSQTDIRALALEADWRKATAEQLRIISGGIYQGMDTLGAETDSARFDLDFLRLRLSGVQSDQFSENWQGVFSTSLYWTDDYLADAEQVVFGGSNFGRGYPNDQASGDKGWGVAYEVNYSIRREGEWLRLLQPYIVVDAARTEFNDLDVADNKLSSTALGLRLGDAKYYNISVEAAKPMADKAIDTHNRRPRLTLSFSYQL